MFEDHKLIRRAAVQCFTNLCASPLHVERCEGKNDKVKYMRFSERLTVFLLVASS